MQTSIIFSSGCSSSRQAKGTFAHSCLKTQLRSADFTPSYSPYYGQAAWFIVFHSEKVPSAIERYQNEVKRVLGVLESVLSKQKWLVADKFTIADLAFVT